MSTLLTRPVHEWRGRPLRPELLSGNRALYLISRPGQREPVPFIGGPAAPAPVRWVLLPTRPVRGQSSRRPSLCAGEGPTQWKALSALREGPKQQKAPSVPGEGSTKQKAPSVRLGETHAEEGPHCTPGRDLRRGRPSLWVGEGPRREGPSVSKVSVLCAGEGRRQRWAARRRSRDRPLLTGLNRRPRDLGFLRSVDVLFAGGRSERCGVVIRRPVGRPRSEGVFTQFGGVRHKLTAEGGCKGVRYTEV